MLGTATACTDSLLACGLYAAASMTLSCMAPLQLHSSFGRTPFSLMSKVARVGITSVLEPARKCLPSAGAKSLLNHTYEALRTSYSIAANADAHSILIQVCVGGWGGC